MSPESKDLIARLRTVGGSQIIKPPAIDIEAANYIEKLENELARLRKGPIDVNMNAEVVTTLSAYGARIWTDDDAAWKSEVPRVKLPLRPMKEGDELKTSLWSLMRLYGECFNPGITEVPFQDNKFRITNTHA